MTCNVFTSYWFIYFNETYELQRKFQFCNIEYCVTLFYYWICCSECSFLWCLLPRTMSTVNPFHVTFSKSRLCIAKPATQAKGLLVFQHTAPFLPTFLRSCLLNSRSAPTSWYRSLFTSRVTRYKVSVPVVQCLSCCCWDMMCFSGWEVAVLLFHLSKAYGRTQCNRGEYWWVNDEWLRQSCALWKEKTSTIPNQLKINI